MLQQWKVLTSQCIVRCAITTTYKTLTFRCNWPLFSVTFSVAFVSASSFSPNKYNFVMAYQINQSINQPSVILFDSNISWIQKFNEGRCYSLLNTMASSKRSFLDTIHFLYIFGKCFGLSCYSIAKGRTKYKVSFGMSDLFHFAAFSGTFLTLIYYNLQLELNNDANNTFIFNQAQQLLITLSLIFLLSGIIRLLLARQSLWNIANTINEIDNRVCV